MKSVFQENYKKKLHVLIKETQIKTHRYSIHTSDTWRLVLLQI